MCECRANFEVGLFSKITSGLFFVYSLINLLRLVWIATGNDMTNRLCIPCYCMYEERCPDWGRLFGFNMAMNALIGILMGAATSPWHTSAGILSILLFVIESGFWWMTLYTFEFSPGTELALCCVEESFCFPEKVSTPFDLILQ